MSEESPRGRGGEGADLEAWIEHHARECGLDRSAFLHALASALQEADGGGASPERVASLEDDLEEKVADVRQRVLQVKRETDQKASVEHSHQDLRRHVARTERQVSEVADATDALRERVAAVETTVDDGFENYEEVLDYLTESADDLEDKTQTLAAALLDVRESVGHLVTGNGTAVDQLATAANRRGVREADCEDCGGAVDVALLREPACPHCGATFADVEASSGWFGSDTLVTGAAPPALEPAADLVEEESDVAAIADGETDD